MLTQVRNWQNWLFFYELMSMNCFRMFMVTVLTVSTFIVLTILAFFALFLHNWWWFHRWLLIMFTSTSVFSTMITSLYFVITICDNNSRIIYLLLNLFIFLFITCATLCLILTFLAFLRSRINFLFLNNWFC